MISMIELRRVNKQNSLFLIHKATQTSKRHVHTYDELAKQKEKLDKEVEELVAEIAKVKPQQSTDSKKEEEEDLDSYMESLSNNMKVFISSFVSSFTIEIER